MSMDYEERVSRLEEQVEDLGQALRLILEDGHESKSALADRLEKYGWQMDDVHKGTTDFIMALSDYVNAIALKLRDLDVDLTQERIAYAQQLKDAADVASGEPSPKVQAFLDRLLGEAEDQS